MNHLALPEQGSANQYSTNGAATRLVSPHVRSKPSFPRETRNPGATHWLISKEGTSGQSGAQKIQELPFQNRSSGVWGCCGLRLWVPQVPSQGAYPNPPALAAAVPSPNTLPPVEPRGLVKAGAEPNAGTPPNPGDPPKVGGLPNTGAAPKPPEQNRGKQTRRKRGGDKERRQ